MERKKKICLLFCGGTIAMAPDPKTQALRPALNPKQLYALAPKIKRFSDIKVVFITDIDSSNMGVYEWTQMTDTIHKFMSQYDAFVITHGTDTMAETANAIAFALGDTLRKPVVLTGSQAPPTTLGTDAIVNLERAMLVAANTTRPEVMISFHDLVLRGTRSRKASERKLAAFHSPAQSPLAEHMGDGLFWYVNPKPPLQKNKKGLYLPYFNPRVIEISLRAAQDAKLMNESLLQRHPGERVTGLVWVSLGAGNVPEIHHDTIQAAINLHVPIVVTSQFPGGRLNMQAYEAGRRALKLGAIPAGDMTPEAAAVKLKWALGLAERKILKKRMSQTQIIPFVKKVFQHNRAQEITLMVNKSLPSLN